MPKTNDFLLIVVHSGERSVITANGSQDLEFLRKEICGKWGSLNSDFSLSYMVGRHTNCVLRGTDDFTAMLMLCEHLNERVIDISVGSSIPNIVHEKSSLESPVGPRKRKNRECTPDKECGTSSRCDDRYEMYSSFDYRSIDPGSRTFHNGESIEFNGELALPTYEMCPDIVPPPLLSDRWKNAITGVGQVFRGGRTEFRAELIKYATKVGFQFTYNKNNAQYIYVICKDKPVSGCSWTIRGKEVSGTGHFEITKAILIHACVGKIIANKTARLGPKIWSKLLVDNVRSKPSHPGAQMKDHLKLSYGFDIPYYKAWRCVEAARDQIFGSYKDSFNQLKWYATAVVRTNPGSKTWVEVDEESKRFKRAFFAFNACLEGFKCCRPMLFIDATFTSSRTKINILSATGKDGNNGLFPVAVAIVQGETLDNWTWFLIQLKDLVKHEKKIFYVSDRNTALLSTFDLVFDEPSNFYCLYHLHNNLKTHYSGPWSTTHRDKMCALLTECAYAPNLRVFDKKIEKFLAAGCTPALASIPFDKWAVAHRPDVMRYGEMTSNAAESFNSWITVARGLPVTYMVDTIRADIMRWFIERRKNAAGWSSLLCSTRQDIWNYHVQLSTNWFVVESGEGKYEVMSNISCTVDTNNHTCTCYQWQIHGFPCAHATAVIMKFYSSISTVIEKCFFVEAYKEAYSGNIIPVPGTEKFECQSVDPESKILPPLAKNTPGRPKYKRKKSYLEVPKKKETLCGICGKLCRHDKLTCPNRHVEETT